MSAQTAAGTLLHLAISAIDILRPGSLKEHLVTEHGIPSVTICRTRSGHQGVAPHVVGSEISGWKGAAAISAVDLDGEVDEKCGTLYRPGCRW
jgi:hypothetical protein